LYSLGDIGSFCASISAIYFRNNKWGRRISCFPW